MNLISEKIPELMQISSNDNLQREISGSIKLSMNTVEPNVNFVNGSWIKAVASTQNARSKRANCLIGDEFRMIDPAVYRNVLRRFLAVSRQPKFLNKPEYKNKPEYQERNQEILLSSCWYKNNWSFDRYKVFLKKMLSGKKYFVCGLPYQFAIKEGLTNREQLLDELSEEDIDEVGWEMEMNAMFFGESAKAYFKFDDLDKNRRLVDLMYPPEVIEALKDKKIKNPPKVIKNDKREIRLVSCDIATMSGQKNDASVFTVMRLIPKTSYFERQVVHIEAVVGQHTENQAIRIRQIYEDFDCDYIVIDSMSGGIGVFDQLVKPLVDRERGKEYSPFSCINNEEMASRCWEQDSPKVIYSIKGNAGLNSDIAVRLKDALTSGKMALPISDMNAQSMLREKFKGYDKLDVDVKNKLLLPYVQTTLLVNEMINLSNEGENGIIKLKEPRSMRKDRFSSLVYGNYIAQELEKETFINKKKKSKDLKKLTSVFKIPKATSSGWRK